MFRRHMPFKDLENWYDPKYAQYDISVHDFLASHGATDAQIRLGYDTNIGYGTASNYFQGPAGNTTVNFEASATPGAIRSPAPALGEHNAAVWATRRGPATDTGDF